MSGNIEGPKISAYTLIELLIVLALIAIVLSIAIPSFRTVLKMTEKKELMEFKRDIIYARNRAVMENRIYTVKFNISENKYIVLEEGNGSEIIKEKSFGNGIVIKSDNVNHTITFYPTGTPNKAGTIRLGNKKGQNITMTIRPATGKVSLKIDGK